MYHIDYRQITTTIIIEITASAPMQRVYKKKYGQKVEKLFISKILQWNVAGKAQGRSRNK